MTESFEGAMVFTEVMFPDCDKSMLDRLQKAHEYDVEELVRQYEQKVIDLQKAHDHDIEQLRRSRFREGYEAGQRSMDAEHYQLKLKLQGIRFEGGSHENLSKLAYAIYPCATGWTCESCEGLRDELVRLLGGVHDGTCPNANRTCPNPVQHASITDDGSDHEPAQGGESGDADCARGDCDRGGSQAVTYDVLGNERHKAVCELRKLTINSDYYGNYQRIARAIGTEYDGKSLASECVRDRLIHLLGGDEPNFTKIAETINLGGKHDSELMENGENHKIATIADELRECVNTATKTYDDIPWHEMGDNPEADHTICHITEGELLRVADRIDARHHLTSLVAEASTSDEWTAMSEYDKIRAERDELRAKLEEADAAIANWREREESFAESERLREELQAKLDAYDRTHVELPKDVNGIPIYAGDTVECVDDEDHVRGARDVTSIIYYADKTWRVSAFKEWFEPQELRHANHDTPDSIVRDLVLGKITERDAINRIQELCDA